MAQSSYRAKKQTQQPQLSLGLFVQENGLPFTLCDPLVLATAATMLVYHHFVSGTFSNNLACSRCGKCALAVTRESEEACNIECRKCFKIERFLFDSAYQFYMTMHPEKVRRSHAHTDEDPPQEPGAHPQKVPTCRIELPMAFTL